MLIFREKLIHRQNLTDIGVMQCITHCGHSNYPMGPLFDYINLSDRTAYSDIDGPDQYPRLGGSHGIDGSDKYPGLGGIFLRTFHSDRSRQLREINDDQPRTSRRIIVDQSTTGEFVD